MYTYPHIHYGIRASHAWKNNGLYHMDLNFAKLNYRLALHVYIAYIQYTPVLIKTYHCSSAVTKTHIYHSNDAASGHSVHHIVHAPRRLALVIQIFHSMFLNGLYEYLPLVKCSVLFRVPIR